MTDEQQNTQDEDVEAQRRRFAGGAPAEDPADVEGHPFRKGGPEADAADVEAHGIIIESDPAADAAQHGAQNPDDDVEGHAFRSR